MSEKLKPCPFCGGEASIKIHYFFDGTRLYTPKCKCGAGIVEVFHAKAEAIAAWNKRAERTCRNDDGWCSECEHFLHDGFNWCPWCGAKVVER